MGIQLDWHIESEQQKQRATEDPSAKRVRRAKRRRLFYTMAVLGGVICVVLGGILWRLRAYENRLRQDLLDTVDAEVRALKVGDEDNYLSIRRSGSDYWMAMQAETFAEYQQLKNEGRLELTGNVIDVAMDIDGSRARVLVEEKVDNVAYEVVWFYWYYTDAEQNGWRRVPPDVAFWGDEKNLEQGQLRVNYYELDQRLAETVSAKVGDWWDQGCQWLSCLAPLPLLTIEIEPRSPAEPSWDVNDEWRLILTSPLYAGRTPLGEALSPELEVRLMQLLAERMIIYGLNSSVPFTPTAYTDTEWLAAEFQRWLIGRFIHNSAGGSPFLETLVAQYGNGAPGLVLRAMLNNNDIGTILLTTVGASLPALSVETLDAMGWGQFFEWRLAAEQRVLRGENIPPGQEIAYHNYFYDESDAAALTAASITRDTYTGDQLPRFVVGVTYALDLAGNLQATVSAATNPADPATIQSIVFRWVQTTWKRVS